MVRNVNKDTDVGGGGDNKKMDLNWDGRMKSGFISPSICI